MKALLLESVHPEAVSALRAAGIDVATAKGAMAEAELVEALPGVDLLGIRSKTQVTGDVLKQFPGLLAVGAFCIGTNQINTDAASELGVAVFNAPFSNTRSVVELAIAEMIALTRRLTEKNASLHAGTWDKSATGAHEMRGRRLGIVGLRQHRQPAVGAGRGARHVGRLLRHSREAGAGQRAQLRVPRRAARDR